MSSNCGVSHEWAEETPEAKALWFRSLCIADRMQLLWELTDLALSVDPSLPEKKHAQSTPGRLQVISAA
jgi:hypothetical protein